MAALGALQLALRSVAGDPIDDRVQIHLKPVSGSGGGQSMRTPEFVYGRAPSCRVANIACQGSGTDYEVRVEGRRYHPAALIQRVAPSDPPEARVRLFIDPARVQGIDPKPFPLLAHSLQAVLNASHVQEYMDAGSFLQGVRLYTGMNALDKACLLNIWSKASHISTGNVWEHVMELRRLEQDRVFAYVTPACITAVQASSNFAPAPNVLHKPMQDFDLKPSFKSKDDKANLQVSFMQNPATGQWAADIDIDEAAGAGHFLEVIRNKFRGRTQPYAVRELLFIDKEIEPPYEFVF